MSITDSWDARKSSRYRSSAWGFMNNWVATLYRKECEFKGKKKEVPTGRMALSSSALEHGLLVWVVPLTYWLKSARVCAFIIKVDAVSSMQLSVRIIQNSLVSECQLRSILLSFLTCEWGLFIPFHHHIKLLSFSRLLCMDSSTNLLLTCHAGWAMTPTKLYNDKGLYSNRYKVDLWLNLFC